MDRGAIPNLCCSSVIALDFRPLALGIRRIILSGLLVVAIVLAWFIPPNNCASGGWTDYWSLPPIRSMT